MITTTVNFNLNNISGGNAGNLVLEYQAVFPGADITINSSRGSILISNASYDIFCGPHYPTINLAVDGSYFISDTGSIFKRVSGTWTTLSLPFTFYRGRSSDISKNIYNNTTGLPTGSGNGGNTGGGNTGGGGANATLTNSFLAAASIFGHRAVMITNTGVVHSNLVSNIYNFVGISVQAAAQGASVDVAVSGSEITENTWNWSAGSSIFVNDNGVLSNIPSAIIYHKIAVALSSNTILVQSETPIFLQ